MLYGFSDLKSSYWQLQVKDKIKIDFEAMVLTAKYINSTCKLVKQANWQLEHVECLLKGSYSP